MAMLMRCGISLTANNADGNKLVNKLLCK